VRRVRGAFPAPAVVFGDLELIQTLGRARIRCVAVSTRDSKVRRSRFVRGGIDAPRTDLIDPGDRVLLDALLEFARSSSAAPVAYCDSDEALMFLSENREALEPAVRFLIPDRELLLDLIDKRRFQRLAERCKLPVPRAQVVSRGETELGVRFPVVLKPVPRRSPRWTAIAGAEKVLRVETPSELRARLRPLTTAGIDLVAQELVAGPEDRLVSYHVYVDADGAVAGEFTGRKIRTFPLERGMSTALTTTDDPEVAELGREVVGRLGLTGVAKLDFKRAHDGTLHLLEINPRFTLWVHAGAVAGVNLPALVHADLTGRPRPASRRARAGVRWVSPNRDLAAARAAGIPLARWAWWAVGCETNSAFAWSDPGPLLGRFHRPGARAQRTGI
jgi:D-aspartate ligase